MAGIGRVELKPSDPCPVKPVFTADVDVVNCIPARNSVRMFADEHSLPAILDATGRIWGEFSGNAGNAGNAKGRKRARNFLPAFHDGCQSAEFYLTYTNLND